MIVFDLTCSHGHRFEGWFASAEEFDREQALERIVCPVCDDAMVARVPSAQVRVSKGAGRESALPDESPVQAQVAGLPAEVLAHLREIVRTTENVGSRFPEEARKIHYEEVPARAIRGQATKDEAESLREEGIDFTSLPDFLTRDSH